MDKQEKLDVFDILSYKAGVVKHSAEELKTRILENKAFVQHMLGTDRRVDSLLQDALLESADFMTRVEVILSDFRTYAAEIELQLYVPDEPPHDEQSDEEESSERKGIRKGLDPVVQAIFSRSLEAIQKEGEFFAPEEFSFVDLLRKMYGSAWKEKFFSGNTKLAVFGNGRIDGVNSAKLSGAHDTVWDNIRLVSDVIRDPNKRRFVGLSRFIKKWDLDTPLGKQHWNTLIYLFIEWGFELNLESLSV